MWKAYCTRKQWGLESRLVPRKLYSLSGECLPANPYLPCALISSWVISVEHIMCSHLFPGALGKLSSYFKVSPFFFSPPPMYISSVSLNYSCIFPSELLRAVIFSSCHSSLQCHMILQKSLLIWSSKSWFGTLFIWYTLFYLFIIITVENNNLSFIE